MKKFLYFVLFLLFTTNICFASDVDLNKFVDEYGQEVQNIIKNNLFRRCYFENKSASYYSKRNSITT